MRAATLVLLLAASACGADERTLLVADWTFGGSKVTLPVHLPLPDRPLTYTLATEIALPTAMRAQTLTLALPYFTGVSRLFVGGQEVANLDGPLPGAHRAGPLQRFQIPAQLARGKALRLTLAVEHQWTMSAWIDCVPRLSATPTGDAWTRFLAAFNTATKIVLLVVVAITGGTMLVLFLYGRRQKKHGWLALGTVCVATYPLFYLGVTERLLGTHDLTLFALLVPLGAVSGIRFLFEHLSMKGPVKLVWAMYLVVLALTLPNAGPFSAIPFASTVVLASVGVAYATVLLLPVVRRLRGQPLPPGTASIWVGWVLITLLSIPDATVWMGIGKLLGGLETVNLGFVLFLFSQAFALAQEHAGALGRAEHLNEELIRQLREREADAQRRRLFADLAHELGTPASTVMAIADTLRGGGAADQRDRLLDLLGREGERLGRLVGDVRLLAFLEQPDLHLELAPTDVSEVAQAACDRANLEGEAQVICRAPGPAVALADRLRLEQVLANLLGNAQRYTPSRGEIVVVVSRPDPDKVRLDVEDSGIGVPEETLARLGERFLRVDPSRSRKTGGHGLGLTIVTTIVQRHGGTIQFRKAALGGLGVTIELPAAGRT